MVLGVILWIVGLLRRKFKNPKSFWIAYVVLWVKKYSFF